MINIGCKKECTTRVGAIRKVFYTILNHKVRVDQTLICALH